MDDTEPTAAAPLRHAGDVTIAALARRGIDTMFTLNGGHVWPFYDAARHLGVRVVDTRHEQTAVFAAEGYAKLTRTPGLAVLTAGPGVTNGVSAITSAHVSGTPLVALGGRAPQMRWGSGSLQEFDHVPVLAPITKMARTLTDPMQAAALAEELVTTALTAHRGPVFADYPLDGFGPLDTQLPLPRPIVSVEADSDAVTRAAVLIAGAERPACIVGSDVYWAGAWEALAAAAANLRLPCWFNGLGRGCLTGGHPLSFLRTRSMVKAEADVVVVIGAPLDFRLSFGNFGSAKVIHVVDSQSQRAAHVEAEMTIVGDLRAVLAAWGDHAAASAGERRDHEPWIERLRVAEDEAIAIDDSALGSAAFPIAPSRIYGELRRRLEPNAVVICDGGDFGSYAGKYVEVQRPGCWLDTGPYGCLGNGPGYAIAARIARPHSQIVLLLGDGAAGFSLMDADTMVRHKLPVVMIVGNNGIWGLEKHPMQFIYGWDVGCDLQPRCRYDEVVRALGGAGEIVTQPDEIGPALDRAFESGVPYLVNVMTDPADMYPRSTNLG
ncbi:MAG: acetolactate synthase [Acidimicrobiia bacterium]